MKTQASRWSAWLSALALAALGSLASAQTAMTPLGDLVATRSSLTAGDITFSNFQFPTILPSPLGLLGEFNDIAVSATTNANGTVSLAFTAINPITGTPTPIVTNPTAGGDQIRLVSYTMTVTNPALRVHSIDQSFGPGTNVTGDTTVFNGLYGVEPVLTLYDLLIFDNSAAPFKVIRGAGFPSADGSGTFGGSGGILLPGGNLATYTMASEFGLVKGHFGFAPGGTLDSITMTYSLVPAGSPVPLVVPNIALKGDTGVYGIIAADGLSIDNAGIGNVLLTNFAQDGGAVVTLSSSNPAALAVPPTVTIPQGYLMAPFVLPPPTVDAPTTVTISASFNGRTVSVPYTINPVTPLELASLQTARAVTSTGT